MTDEPKKNHWYEMYELECLKTKELEKENAELKSDNDARKFAMAMSENVEKQLRNERNTFLAQNEQYEKDLINFNDNLTKAKEIIEKVSKMYRYSPRVEEIIAEAEQFLKENK